MKITNRGVVAITSPGNVISSQSTTTSPTHFHFSLSLSHSLQSSLLVWWSYISDARQTARPLDYKLQIVTVFRFEASKVNSSFHLRQRFPNSFFFFQKRIQFLKYPHRFCLLTKIENKNQNPKPSSVLSPHIYTTRIFAHSRNSFTLRYGFSSFWQLKLIEESLSLSGFSYLLFLLDFFLVSMVLLTYLLDSLPLTLCLMIIYFHFIFINPLDSYQGIQGYLNLN